MITGKQERLSFNVKANTYSFDGCTYTLPRSICYGCGKGIQGPPSCHNRFLEHPITFVNDSIIFYSSGIIQSGSVYLTDIDKSVMYALSVPVSQVSFVRMYRYDTKWVEIS